MDGLFKIPPYAAAAPAGVLFAEDFDVAPTPKPPSKPRPAFTAAELEAARADAYAEGREIGLAEAVAQNDAALADATRALASKLVALRHDATAGTERAAAALANQLVGCFATLFPAACAALGPAEAAAVLRAVLPGLGAEPTLSIRANPRSLPLLIAELTRLDPALASRVSTTPSELLASGDVALAWSHGAASRDANALWAALAAALAPGLILPPLPEHPDAR